MDSKTHTQGTLVPLFGEVIPPTTRLYFGYGANGQVKIGITKRKISRRGGEMWFTELCSLPGGRAEESQYHTKYAKERIGRTEWFWLSDHLLMDLLTMTIGQDRHQATEILKNILYRRLQGRNRAA
jgi:hypothetical protein